MDDPPPAKVVTAPSTDTTLMRSFPESAMKTRPSAASALCPGVSKPAVTASPPSPLKPVRPPPAKRRTAPLHWFVATSGELVDIQLSSTARTET